MCSAQVNKVGGEARGTGSVARAFLEVEGKHGGNSECGETQIASALTERDASEMASNM